MGIRARLDILRDSFFFAVSIYYSPGGSYDLKRFTQYPVGRSPGE